MTPTAGRPSTGRIPLKPRQRFYLLGNQQRQRVLARVKFGRHVILMTADELKSIGAVIEQYVESRGTSFGFVNYLVDHVRA